jgi:diaminopimelate epimerase
MQGLGNDYLYVYGEPQDPEAWSIRLSERHFGAGADGMIWIAPSAVADFKMRIFNADGSEAKMCGNGIRCVGKYVHDKGYTDKTELTIETLSGIKALQLHLTEGKVSSVTVEMGTVAVAPERTLFVGGEPVVCTPVDVGNPHTVLFVDDAEAAPLTTLGPAIERHAAFPGGVNVEFVQVLRRNELRMRVWERGSGVTLACGTGACASAAAAAARGECDHDAEIQVRLDGGTLRITVGPDGNVRMEGPCEFVYEGDTEIC